MLMAILVHLGLIALGVYLFTTGWFASQNELVQVSVGVFFFAILPLSLARGINEVAATRDPVVFFLILLLLAAVIALGGFLIVEGVLAGENEALDVVLKVAVFAVLPLVLMAVAVGWKKQRDPARRQVTKVVASPFTFVIRYVVMAILMVIAVVTWVQWVS